MNKLHFENAASRTDFCRKPQTFAENRFHCYVTLFALAKLLTLVTPSLIGLLFL